MDDFFVMHSSDVDLDELPRLLADRIAHEQVRQFRRSILRCFAIVMMGAWLLSWPLDVLPHTVLWSVLATAVMVIGLMSPPLTRATTPDKPSTLLR